MTAPPSPHDEDVLGKAYDRRLARRLLHYVRPFRALVIGATLLLLIEGLLQLVGPILTRRVIDEALPRHDVGLVTKWVGIYAVTLLLSFAASFGETMLTSLLGQR